MTAAVLLGEPDLGAIATRVALRGTSSRADAEFAERAEQDIEELLALVEALDEELLDVKEEGEEAAERHGHNVATNAVAETMALFGPALEALYFCQGLARLFALTRARPARAAAPAREPKPKWLKKGARVAHPSFPKPGVVTGWDWNRREAFVLFADAIPCTSRRVAVSDLHRITPAARPGRRRA